MAFCRDRYFCENLNPRDAALPRLTAQDRQNPEVEETVS